MITLEMNRLRNAIVPAIMFAILAPIPSGLIAYADERPVSETVQVQTFTIEHTIKSQFPVQDRFLTVRLPEDYYEEPDDHYPILYVLDGENNTEFTKSVATFLADGSQIPELIVVGVHSGATRQVDYMPQAEADRFLDFLEKELFTFIDTHYRAGPYRMLSGHSLGGLLSTYAMTERPGLFQAHFAQSPGFNGDQMSESVDRLLTETPELQGAYYITLGDEPNLEAGFNAMKKVLEEKAPTAFRWNADRQAGRSHMQTRLIGTYRALEHTFAADWPMPASLLKEIDARKIKAHMASVSNKYGVDEESYAVDTLIGAVQALFQNRDINGAASMAEIFVGEYPENVAAHFFLANAYANSDKLGKALEHVNLSIGLIESGTTPAEDTAQLLARLQQMRTRLGGN